MQENNYEQIQKINAALDVLELAFRVPDYIGIDNYNCLFEKNLEISKEVTIKGRKRTKEQIDEILHNQKMSSICSLVLVLDEAFNDVFGTKDFINQSNIDDLRSVIYMLRCAFSHNPCAPKWIIKKTKNNKKENKYFRCIELYIPQNILQKHKVSSVYLNGQQTQKLNKIISFDFTKLNGKLVYFEDFEGLSGLILLSQMTQEILINYFE